MNLIKKCCLGFILLLLLLMATVLFLVGTTSGLHLLINSAARWVPGLEIASVVGGWRDLTLKGVKYQMPGVSVNAGQFYLSLDLSCLKRSSLCVNALTAQDINVVVNTAEIPPSAPPENSSEPLTNLSTPYPITLRLFSLNNLKVQVDDTALSLGKFSSGAQWQGRALALMPTSIDSLLIAVPKTPVELVPTEAQAKETDNKTASLLKAEETALGETLKNLFAHPLLPALPEMILPLDITVQEIRGERLQLTGDHDLLVTHLLLKLNTQAQHLQLDNLDIQSPQGELSAKGQLTLNGNWPVEITARSRIDIEPIKNERVELNIAGGLREELQLKLDLSGPVNAQLEVQTRLAESGLPLLLTLQSKQLQWPLSGEPEYRVQDFRLRFNGKATDYALSTRAKITGQQLPASTLTLEGKGDLEQFNLERLRVTALEGNTVLTAKINWSKAISWVSQLTISGINTAKQWPDWPVRLEGEISTRGSLHGGSWQLQIPVLQLNGTVKKQQISAKGTLTGNAAGQWNIPELELALGRNHFNVTGRLDENKWALDSRINAPGLDGILPGLAGAVMGQLRLRGDLSAPQILAEVSATGLQWQTLHIGRATLNADIRSTDHIQGQLALRVEQLQQDALSVALLTLNAKGSERQHTLRVEIEGKPVSGQLALQGGFERQQQRWRGSVNNTRFDTPIGDWRLTRPITLDYLHTQQKVSIGPHCWSNPNAELCVPRTIEAGASGQASVALTRFDLAMLKPLLGPETTLSGVFSGGANIHWQEGTGLPQGNISLVGNGVKVVQQVQGKALPIGFDTLNFNAGLNRSRGQADWSIKLANNGQFNGNLQITDPQVRRAINGNINISNISLELLKPILSPGEKASGVLSANLQLGGRVQAPLVFGRLALDKALMAGHWMPFDMTDGRLVINFDGMTSKLEGLLATTHGQLNMAGDADWRDLKAWRARIATKGERLRVTIPPMVRIDVSPDLVFEATPQLFSLNGSVDIPWARITVQELPESAVGVSSDEVMLDPQLNPIEPATASIPINSNLRLRVGDDVQLDAFGLKARLRGNLQVVQDRNGVGLNGYIDIPAGRFHAYGQDLMVRKGQLLFSGPPDQPLLNIEAIRNPGSTQNNVTAGVRVTGMADAPRLEVFSDPAMSQKEALSYLLRGQGLSNSGADGNAMTSMLIGMGVAQSGQLVGKIGEAFGVSNLALDTEGVGDSSQVVVSGYVLPDLQVKYGIGIFDSLATLTLRYRLMPRLYLEAVSGLDQALDVLYQFEF